MARPDVAALVEEVRATVAEFEAEGRGYPYVIVDLADALEGVEQERTRLEEALKEIEADESGVYAEVKQIKRIARAALSPEDTDG